MFGKHSNFESESEDFGLKSLTHESKNQILRTETFEVPKNQFLDLQVFTISPKTRTWTYESYFKIAVEFLCKIGKNYEFLKFFQKSLFK